MGKDDFCYQFQNGMTVGCSKVKRMANPLVFNSISGIHPLHKIQ